MNKNNTLSMFRRRIALTNKKAGYHYLALARAERGMDPLDKDTSYFRATADEREKGIGHGTWPWANRNRYIEALNGRNVEHA